MELLDKSTYEDWMERIMERLDELADVVSHTPKRPTYDGEPLLDYQEVCQLLNISKRTLQRYKDEGLVSYPLFHKTWYKESDILAFMKKHFDEKLKRKRVRKKK